MSITIFNPELDKDDVAAKNLIGCLVPNAL
jgi:hypothetical protein